MGRKKKTQYKKVGTFQVRMSAEYRDWIEAIKAKAGDEGDTTYFERLCAREAKRLKLPPPPPR